MHACARCANERGLVEWTRPSPPCGLDRGEEFVNARCGRELGDAARGERISSSHGRPDVRSAGFGPEKGAQGSDPEDFPFVWLLFRQWSGCSGARRYLADRVGTLTIGSVAKLRA